MIAPLFLQYYTEEKESGDEMSGGYVSIGMVFEQAEGARSVIPELMSFLLLHGHSFQTVSYSEDADGERWITVPATASSVIEAVSSGWYATVEMTTAIAHEKVQIRFTETASAAGFLMDIPWEAFIRLDHATVTNQVANGLIGLHSAAPFRYAFGGHELEIEHSPSAFESMITERTDFPLSIVAFDDHFLIAHGTIGMDGITPQQTHVEKRKR